MAKSRSTLRDNLNTYTGDSANAIWTAAQKNLSLNLAIQAAAPDIKTVAWTSFTLAAASYIYTLAAMTRDLFGPQQVWCAISSATSPVYCEMRGSVIRKRDGNTWSLDFAKTWVDNRGGYIVKVAYNQEYPELGSDATTTEVPEVFLIQQALYELCSMETLKGHHTDVEAFRRKAPDFFERAERERVKRMVLPLPVTIGLRWE